MTAEETNTAFEITPVKTYSKDLVLVAARAVVEEFGPHYLYRAPFGNSCVYTYPNDEGEERPSCLVGQILVRLGIPLEAVAELDGAWFEVEEELEHRGYRFTSEASRALTAAQTVQDMAVDAPGEIDATWGAALRAAEEAA